MATEFPREAAKERERDACVAWLDRGTRTLTCTALLVVWTMWYHEICIEGPGYLATFDQYKQQLREAENHAAYR